MNSFLIALDNGDCDGCDKDPAKCSNLGQCSLIEGDNVVLTKKPYTLVCPDCGKEFALLMQGLPKYREWVGGCPHCRCPMFGIFLPDSGDAIITTFFKSGSK